VARKRKKTKRMKRAEMARQALQPVSLRLKMTMTMMRTRNNLIAAFKIFL
jgi:hypothetical protein